MDILLFRLTRALANSTVNSRYVYSCGRISKERKDDNFNEFRFFAAKGIQQEG